MDRRRYLRAVGLGLAGGLAGCLSGTESTPTASPGPAGPPDLPIPRSALERGAAKDSIPAITEPAFGPDWSGVEVPFFDREFDMERSLFPELEPDDLVVGVSRNGDARAYPLRILNWHEVVNEDFHGPLLVTYCPLCATGLTAVRTVDGQETVFGVTGLLWKDNLVMYDTLTSSLWSQVLGQAIRGRKTGAQLDLVPSTLTAWGDWKTANPDTEVLLPPPESNTVEGPQETRNYDLNPYSGYADSRRIGLSERTGDTRLHPKTLVVGITHDGVAKAYPLPAVVQNGTVVNDEIAGLPVVVALGPEETLHAYVREVDGETLTFDIPRRGVMEASGSTWRVSTGTAISGPHEGTTLRRANGLSPMFWFSWADVHPDTRIFEA